MANSVYYFNREINRSIEFKGLRAQYIAYLAILVILLFGIYGLIYALGLPSVYSALLVGLPGGLLMRWIFRLNIRYGEHGLAKKIARYRMPQTLRWHSRTIFLKPIEMAEKERKCKRD